ncbi:NAD-dependent epimerase/dehydratase family protein [Pseudonocardia humida]|uniref:NAD(P)-dependent oxidoreductase n=1 Tax=Pseudonocardia humida TaxID=2800819 RepID=A0ABT0ZY58_9PSEU|nr:NAD(P)-dependent oxidoreductase [Pseudonocardia humida]MCO1655680.1 NAD(P)-dependent oxidoreductase [Pseudonocardia humida]
MRIAITGAAGALGRRVVDRAVRAGHDVVAVDLPGTDAAADVEWRRADITDLGQVRAALDGVRGVVHLGALTHPRHPEPEVFRTNVNGTHHVLVAAEEHGVDALCLASSVNAIGGVFSAVARYDRFPVTEQHPSYCEDSYSVSKWILEQESAAFARRRPDATFTALRLHALRDDHAHARATMNELHGVSQLWGWTSFDSAAAACLLALHRPTAGHAVCHVVAARTTSDAPSAELARRWYPDVAVDRPLTGRTGFYATDAAHALLGWDAGDEHPALSDAERAR